MDKLTRYDSLDMLLPEFKTVIDSILKDIDLHRLPFKVFETGRYKERQERLVKEGRSRTMNSYHLVDENGKGSKAVDFVVYIPILKDNNELDKEYESNWSWAPEHTFWYKILIELVLGKYPQMKQKGTLNRIIAGGNWASFKDYPHFEFHP